jgi:capsular polysaccharide biosynthesis protein
MGYDDDDWVELSGRDLRVKTLVVPSYPEPTPDSLKWLRSRLMDSIPDTASIECPERILLIRSDQRRRRFVNQREVEKCLSKYGFESVAPEKLSVAEQIRYFSKAEVIVGAHGSGFINMLWADEPHIIELFGYLVACAFYQLASVLEYEYDALLCDHESARHLRVDTRALSSLVESKIY